MGQPGHLIGLGLHSGSCIALKVRLLWLISCAFICFLFGGYSGPCSASEVVCNK